MLSMIAASVVDVPDPELPQISTSPDRSSARRHHRRRQPEIAQRRHSLGHGAEHRTHRVALEERAEPEAADRGNRVRGRDLRRSSNRCRWRRVSPSNTRRRVSDPFSVTKPSSGRSSPTTRIIGGLPAARWRSDACAATVRRSRSSRCNPRAAPCSPVPPYIWSTTSRRSDRRRPPAWTVVPSAAAISRTAPRRWGRPSRRRHRRRVRSTATGEVTAGDRLGKQRPHVADDGSLGEVDVLARRARSRRRRRDRARRRRAPRPGAARAVRPRWPRGEQRLERVA